MDLVTGATHHLVIPYATSGLLRSDWTMLVFMDGDIRQDINVTVREIPAGIYVFSFTNDGTDKSQWTLIVYPTAAPAAKFWTDWGVRSNIIEQSVATLRAANDLSLNPISQPKINDTRQRK